MTSELAAHVQSRMSRVLSQTASAAKFNQELSLRGIPKTDIDNAIRNIADMPDGTMAAIAAAESIVTK